MIQFKSAGNPGSLLQFFTPPEKWVKRTKPSKSIESYFYKTALPQKSLYYLGKGSERKKRENYSLLVDRPLRKDINTT